MEEEKWIDPQKQLPNELVAEGYFDLMTEPFIINGARRAHSVWMTMDVWDGRGTFTVIVMAFAQGTEERAHKLHCN